MGSKSTQPRQRRKNARQQLQLAITEGEKDIPQSRFNSARQLLQSGLTLKQEHVASLFQVPGRVVEADISDFGQIVILYDNEAELVIALWKGFSEEGLDLGMCVVAKFPRTNTISYLHFPDRSSEPAYVRETRFGECSIHWGEEEFTATLRTQKFSNYYLHLDEDSGKHILLATNDGARVMCFRGGDTDPYETFHAESGHVLDPIRVIKEIGTNEHRAVMVNCSELPGGAWVQDAQIMIENTWVSKVYKAIHIKSFGLRKLTPDTEPTHCFVARSFENKMLLVHPDGEIDLGDGWDFCEEAVHVLDDGRLILHNMGTKVLFDPLNPGWGPYTGIHLAQSVQYWSKPSVGDRTLDYLVVLGQGTYKQHEVRIHMLGIPRGHFSVNEPLFGATDMLIVGDVILTQTKNRLGQRVLHWNRDWWYPSPALSGNLPLHGDLGRLKQVGPHKVMSWKCEGNNFAVIIYDTQSKAFRF